MACARGDLRVGADKRGLGLVERGLGVVQLRLRADMGLEQLRGTHLRHAPHCRPQPDRRVFCACAWLSEARAASVCASMRSSVLLKRGDLRLGLGDRNLVVAVIDDQQRIAGLHLLVLGHLDLVDIAGDLRRNERHVGLDIGVVGRDHEAPVGPVMVAVPGAGAQQAERDDGQQQRARRTLLLAPAASAGVAVAGSTGAFGASVAGATLALGKGRTSAVAGTLEDMISL